MLLAHERTQRAEQRRIGKFGLPLLDALAAQRDRVLGREPMLELADQSGLADPRVTADQHHDRASLRRLPPGQLQLGELPDAADEVTAGQTCPHERSIATSCGPGDRAAGATRAAESPLIPGVPADVLFAGGGDGEAEGGVHFWLLSVESTATRMSCDAASHIGRSHPIPGAKALAAARDPLAGPRPGSAAWLTRRSELLRPR